MIPNPNAATYKSLTQQFLPMSASDLVMALGDPIILFVLASLPKGPEYLAAFAIGKGIAVFFESPIIAILPASNALAPYPQARTQLFTFTCMAGITLTLLMLLLGTRSELSSIIGVTDSLWDLTATIVLLLAAWPLCIALRRYWQGHIIRSGAARHIAIGALIRCALLTAVAFIGAEWAHSGEWLAAAALMTGVIGELAYIHRQAQQLTLPNELQPQHLPTCLKSISQYYWPLAHAMITFWGARLVLPILIAAIHLTEIAAWSAAWAIVITASNSVRMVQQLVIKNLQNTPSVTLRNFSLGIGAILSTLLLLATTTDWGQNLSTAYSSGDPLIASKINQILLASAALPLLMAVQHYLLGILMHQGITRAIGRAALIANLLLVIGAFWLSTQSYPAHYFALLVCLATGIEILLLYVYLKKYQAQSAQASFSVTNV